MKDRNIKRDSFILYKSFYGPISLLTDEQLGRLFRSIYLWQIDGEANPEPDIQIAFGFFINQFRIDNEKYTAKCEQYRENGKMGGRPKKTNRLSGNQSVSKKAKKHFSSHCWKTDSLKHWILNTIEPWIRIMFYLPYLSQCPVQQLPSVRILMVMDSLVLNNQ